MKLQIHKQIFFCRINCSRLLIPLRYIRKDGFVSIVIVFFFNSLFAQIDTTKHFEIKEITITIAPQLEIIPSQKLSGKQLYNLSSHSVTNAIRYFSGVQIKDYGGIGGLKTVDIRSMGAHHTAVFYDGIQIGNAQTGQVDLGKFSLDNMEEVSLYNGQKSEMFQSARDFASASSIYLKTRRPTFEKGKNYNIRAKFSTGSFGLANPAIVWEQKITKSVSTTLNTEYTYATGKYKFKYRRVLPNGNVAYDTTAVRQNGDIQSYRIEGGLFGNAKKIFWDTKLYFYNSERGIPCAIVNNVWKNSQRIWDRNFFIQGAVIAHVYSRYELLTRIKYANDFLRFKNMDTTMMILDNRFIQQELNTALTQKVRLLKGWELSLATDFQWNYLKTNRIQMDIKNYEQYPHRFSTLVALATAVEFWKIKALANILGTLINEKIGNKQKFTPAVFISYKPVKNEEFHIRFFYKQIFRMPTFNDLYYTEIVNNKLQPEEATQFNLGLQYSKIFNKGVWESIMFKTDGYYNIIKDKVIAVYKGNSLVTRMMMNIGLVKIHGIDVIVLLNWKFKDAIRMQAQLNYTFQKARDYTDPADNDAYFGTYKGQISYIPLHSGSFTLQFVYKTYQLNYSFIYVGERYSNSANIRENYLQPWYTHDLSLGKEFCFKKRKFSVLAEVNNLLNQQFEVVDNFPMPGTNFRVVLLVKI
jgi:outer membrane cobalamin receptor